MSGTARARRALAQIVSDGSLVVDFAAVCLLLIQKTRGAHTLIVHRHVHTRNTYEYIRTVCRRILSREKARNASSSKPVLALRSLLSLSVPNAEKTFQTQIARICVYRVSDRLSRQGVLESVWSVWVSAGVYSAAFTICVFSSVRFCLAYN